MKHRKLVIALVGAFTLLSGMNAHAKKDKEPHTGGMSPQHMSQTGQSNTNNPTMGQDKGSLRSDDRKSDQGLLHDNDGKKDDKGKGKAKGHAK